jgi:hypothetical protein
MDNGESGAGCRVCAHFVGEALALEAALPGLNILSSAFGAVRAETGLCEAHEAFVTPRPPCPAFRHIPTR